MEKFLPSFLIACLIMAASGESSLKELFSKYKFHFKTGDTGDHTRTEESDDSGHVTGMYSYKDPNGIVRTVRYNAAPELGYQAYGEGFPQFGTAPMEYYYVSNPSSPSVSQLETENTNNGTISEEPEAQASEVSTVTDSSVDGLASTTALVPEILTDIESEATTESSVETLSTTEAPSVSSEVNNSRLVPIWLPYGSFHKILIHSGHLYYPVSHALPYNLVAPNYQLVL